ncbi:MAG: hypothetical protein H7282_13025 [Cytophagaceae bacterium]|nr:hypothetical protein [Cytophagaceae bacterium]
MLTQPIIKRTTAGTPGFMFLIKQPNHTLWNVFVLFCPIEYAGCTGLQTDTHRVAPKTRISS